MKKFSKLVLMLCLVLSGALCYASNATKTENKKGNGITLEVKQKVFHGSSDKSGSIVPTLDGHVLTVIFTENLGQVAVEVSTAVGTLVHYSLTPTPNGVQVYILDTGDFIITFTLSNGDEYYGEFTVTD